jgi:hypothetical protein
MLGQKLPNPGIFAIRRANYDDEIIARDVVSVEKVGGNLEEAEAFRYDEKGVFAAEVMEDILLKSLRELGIESRKVEWAYEWEGEFDWRSAIFHGGLENNKTD